MGDPVYWVRPPRRPRDSQWYGFGSMLMAAVTAVAAAVGVVLFIFGGFLLLALAAVTAVAALLMAVVSLAKVVREPVAAVPRIAKAMPALFTLGAAGLGVYGIAYDGSDGPVPAPRAMPAAAPPNEVVLHAALMARHGELARLCTLLSEPVRGPRCADDPVLRGPFPLTSAPKVVRSDERTAVVSYRVSSAMEETPTHRVRLVRRPEGWELVDVPMVFDRCVDTAKDPFTCPMRTIGPAP